MNQKQLFMDMRNSRTLKGIRPAVVFLNSNYGGIYKGFKSYFVMSVYKEELYLQKLSFFKKYKSGFDLHFLLSDIKYFIYKIENKAIKSITFYLFDGNYLPVYFYYGCKDSYTTEVNIDYLLKLLKDKGIKAHNILKDKNGAIINEE